ncbi:MAG: formylglycine-generating enzyme family protein [Euryarchaeota archaeon]|nr:formylglycine-generating enzyme family protein [Euryarchaeota archaeon]
MEDSKTPRDARKPIILREYEFFGGCIRAKISVKNLSDAAILDVALDPVIDENILHFDRHEPDEYSERRGKILLGNIYPDSDRTIALYLDPLICVKEGTDLDCFVRFKDASGRLDSVQMETLKIQVVCPIFRTEQDINIGRLKELISGSAFHDSKVYAIQRRIAPSELMGLCESAIQLHDVRHVKTFKTTDEKNYEAWYYGRTKVTKKDLMIKISIRRDTESIEVFAAGDNPGDITGLLAEIGRNLEKQFEGFGRVQPVFNISIKDSVVQRSNLLSFCEIDGTCGGNVVIEDSVVQRSSVGAANVVRLRDGGEEEEQRAREEAERKKRDEKERLRRGAEEQQKKEKEEQERIRKEEEEKKERERKAREETERKKKEQQKKLAEQDNSIGMKFTLIPAGEFMMGSEEYDPEKPVHKVKINKPFYLGTYPVTQAEWKAVMGNNPSHCKGDDLPVEQVSWNDVQEFIKKLNEKEGTDKYRLPSEAEWEYACRAGTTTRYSFGDSESKLDDYAWYDDNSGYKTHPVGRKKPNSYGLYDMYGNVREWVQDTWRSDYDGAPTDGSAWESGDSPDRVLRGGSWRSLARYCRPAYRGSDVPGNRNFNLGFRLLEET